jgi:hypothetical protein
MRHLGLNLVCEGDGLGAVSIDGGQDHDGGRREVRAQKSSRRRARPASPRSRPGSGAQRVGREGTNFSQQKELMKPPGSGEATGNVLKQLQKAAPRGANAHYEQPSRLSGSQGSGWQSSWTTHITEVLAAAGAGSNFSRLLARANDSQKKPEGNNVVQPWIGNGNSFTGDARFCRPAGASGWPQGCRTSIGGERKGCLPSLLVAPWAALLPRIRPSARAQRSKRLLRI